MIAPHASKFLEINPKSDFITLKYPRSTFNGANASDIIVEAEFYSVIGDVVHQWKICLGIVLGALLVYYVF